jgi:pyridoxal phosphate enzyme (YggS family)
MPIGEKQIVGDPPIAGNTPAPVPLVSRDPIHSRLGEVHARIDRAARDSGRGPAAVKLVCVSKTFPMEAISPVLDLGERVFGENRVQEAKNKWPALKAKYPGVELHLIGPLQTNKAREAVELFDVIETIDRPRIAEAVAAEIARSGKHPKLFIEINTGSEAQKAGVTLQDAEGFIRYCREDLHLAIEGLMCIPPDSEQRSPHFALLSTIARQNQLSCLSMGMSADYELAIQLGATHVRVGSAIFGARVSVGG